MSKSGVIVPSLLALLVATAACLPASAELPAAYPTTGAPAFSIPNVATPPAASQTPANPYVAWSQAGYGSTLPAGQQVACYSSPCAPACGGTGECAGQPNPYASPEECPYPVVGSMGCQPEAVWLASFDGLLMSINESHHHYFSYDGDVAHEDMQYTDSRSVNVEWAGGFEVALRRFGACSCTGWEGIYWGLFPNTEETRTYPADLVVGPLNGINNWDQLDYGAAGETAADYVNNAAVHRLRRDVEVHNAEINHIVLMSDTCCMPWRAQMLCGVRFFRYSDDLQFMSDTSDPVTYQDGPIHYDMDMDNTLVGFQVGGWSEYQLGCRWSVAGGAKVGVYNNHMTSYQRIGGPAGTAVINNGPNVGDEWCVDVSKDDVALLGELKLAVLYQITPCWRANLGYRVVGVSGVALPTDQIYPDLRGINDVELVDSHGSLFMYGFTASIEYQF